MITPGIQYITYNDIDKTRWDACIDKGANGLIYAYSFYLDTMAKHWDALVYNDYEAVMPLTWNKKYGFYYLYQPAFTASLGVFGNDLDENKVNSFLSQIPSKFKLAEISLNHGNYFNAKIENCQLRTNYILSLDQSYDQLYTSYRANHKRNISKAKQLGCLIDKNVTVEQIIELHENHLKHIDGTKPDDYINFKKLFHYLDGQNNASVYAITDHNKKILSSAIFFFSHKRAYYILVGNHPDGKTLGASHALIDAFIQDHAGTDLILDFEGSDIRNLAFFYSGFGAKEENYPFLKINNLPWYVRLLKK